MAPRARVERLDTVIAFLVATISILSAVVAARAAVWSSTASDTDSVVLQEAIEARQIESDLDSAAAGDLRMAARYDAVFQRVRQMSIESNGRWTSDPTVAARLDLDAQAEFGVDLALWHFFRAQAPAYGVDGRLVFDVEGAIDAQRAADPRLTELARSDAPRRAAEAHGRTIALVAIAVLFVGALFVLTIAEVWPGRGRRAPLLVGAGLAAAAAAVTVATDPDTAMVLGAIAVVACAALAVALWLPARRERHAAAAEGDVVVDEDGTGALEPSARAASAVGATAAGASAHDTAPHGAIEADDPRGRFRSAVVVVLAAATLLGAAVGYLQSAASDLGAATTREAQDQALLALTEHQRATEWAAANLEVWSLVEEHRARADGARQLARYLETTGDAGGAAEATADAERWEQAAEDADALTVLGDDHPDGPVADPAFPTRFLVRQAEGRAERVARQDLANEASAAWGTRAAAYLAVLATLAIAAYLLGLSLVLRAAALRTLFAVVGVGLVAVAGFAAGVTALARDTSAQPGERDAIARAFATGRIATQAARSPAERTQAVAAYRRVVAMHPSLARAHVELAGALFDESSPQTSGYLSVATIDSVEAALAELSAARDLGWDDLATRGDRGFYEMLVGLARPGAGLSAVAVADTGSALALGPDLPVLRFNHAAALLADGQLEQARDAYADAIAATMARDGDDAFRFSEAERSGVVAGAVTDLELIAAARPDDAALATAVAEAKAAIVAGTGDPIGADASAATVTVSDLQLFADPATLWWQARIEGFEPARDRVSVLWFEEDPGVPGWHVLPGHSGSLRLDEWTPAGEFHLNGDAPDYWAGQGYLLLSDPHRCVPDGRYRVELYVNGRLASAPVEATLDMPELVTESHPDLGLLFCRPADWRTGTDRRGDTIAFDRADGSPAMLVTRVHRPNPPGDAGAAEVAEVLDAVAAAWPGSPVRMPGVEPADAYLMGLEDAGAMWYDVADARLKVFAGATNLGTVIAVALAGTPDWVDSQEASDLIGAFALQ